VTAIAFEGSSALSMAARKAAAAGSNSGSSSSSMDVLDLLVSHSSSSSSSEAATPSAAAVADALVKAGMVTAGANSSDFAVKQSVVRKLLQAASQVDAAAAQAALKALWPSDAAAADLVKAVLGDLEGVLRAPGDADL
jgi:hypothetical protein